MVFSKLRKVQLSHHTTVEPPARMWKVAGEIAFTATPQKVQYHFSIVEYRLWIDATPWTVVAACADSLDIEFDEEFWQLVNRKRKAHPDFADVPWLVDHYDVAPAYAEVQLPVYTTHATVSQTVRPFHWTDPYLSYLKVHPDGVAVFALDKKLEFLLTYIAVHHTFIPSTPLYQVEMDRSRRIVRLHSASLLNPSHSSHRAADTAEPSVTDWVTSDEPPPNGSAYSHIDPPRQPEFPDYRIPPEEVAQMQLSDLMVYHASILERCKRHNQALRDAHEELSHLLVLIAIAQRAERSDGLSADLAP